MRDVVVLLSGGLDSTVLATMALQLGRLHSVVSYAYGAPHGFMEGQAAHGWAVANGVTRIVESLPLVGVDDAMKIGTGEPGARVLPGRNLVMLAHAVNYAATVGAREVWFGATADDAADYPDCRPAFVDALNEVTGGVRVIAPLAFHRKAQVVAEARALGVDIDATWSCYEPRANEPCGTCNACRLRGEAMGCCPGRRG